MITWPCLLKLDGDDELIYLSSANALTIECQDLILSDDDGVIDSSGSRYVIQFISAHAQLVATEDILSVDDVSQLIRAHEFNKASLCLTKISFLSVADAIKSLSY